MKKYSKLITIAICALICVACVIILVSISKKPEVEKQDVGVLVDRVPTDDEFVIRPQPVEVPDVVVEEEPVAEEQEPVVVEQEVITEPTNNDTDVIVDIKDSADSYRKGLSEAPEGLMELNGVKEFMDSDFYSDDMTWNYVERGASCMAYVRGAYNVEIEWIYAYEDCSIFVYNPQDRDDVLAHFGAAY